MILIMVIPIIEVSNITNATMITMRQEDFLKTFQDKTPDYVFKIQYEDGSDFFWRFFPYMDGLFINILGDQSETWEDFIGVVEEWSSPKFRTKKQYLDAVDFGIKDYEAYNEFKKSDFLEVFEERKKSYTRRNYW